MCVDILMNFVKLVLFVIFTNEDNTNIVIITTTFNVFCWLAGWLSLLTMKERPNEHTTQWALSFLLGIIYECMFSFDITAKKTSQKSHTTRKWKRQKKYIREKKLGLKRNQLISQNSIDEEFIWICQNPTKSFPLLTSCWRLGVIPLTL